LDDLDLDDELLPLDEPEDASVPTTVSPSNSANISNNPITLLDLPMIDAADV
jgi:hypothetical protein